MKVSQDAVSGGVAIVACGTLYGLFMGTVRMSSLLFVACIARYDVDRNRASFPFVLAFAVRNIIGPAVGFFSKQFGIRTVVISGVLLSSIAIGACSLAEDIVTITVFWGVGHGIGYGFGTLLLPHYLSMHFSKHLDKANGITLAGECITYFLLSVLTEHLLDTYGLSGTFLILSGIMLHGLLAALLLKSPTRTHDNCGSPEEIRKIHITANDTEDFSSESCNKITKWRKSSMSDNCGSPEERRKIHITANDTEDFASESCNKITKRRKSSMSDNSGCPEESRKIQVTTNGLEDLTLESRNKISKQQKSSMSVFRVLLNPVYILIVFTQSIMLYLFSTTTTVLIDVSRDHGVSIDYEVYLFLSLSIGDVIGRTLLGSLTDAGCLTKMNFSALSFAGIGLLYAACAWIKSFVVMIVFSFFFGLLIGGLLMISPGVVTFYVEKQYLSVAIASRLILYPPISFTQAPLIGYFRDFLQSYNAMFYVLMGLCCACCIISLIIPLLAKCREAKKEPFLEEIMAPPSQRK